MNRGAGNRRGGAGVPGAGVSNAGAGGPPSEVTIETVSRELAELCGSLCTRRNTALRNLDIATPGTATYASIKKQAIDLDSRARSILWVVERAGLEKLEMHLDPLVTLSSIDFGRLYH